MSAPEDTVAAPRSSEQAKVYAWRFEVLVALGYDPDDALDIELLEGFTLGLSRKIDAQMVAGSGFDPGACTGSQLMVRGKFNILYKDETIQAAALNHSKIALNFKLVGVIPGAGGTHPYVIDVYLPNCRFTVPQGPDVVDGPIIVGGDYVARRDPTLRYACRITVQTTFNSQSLGGAYPLNPTNTVLDSATSVGSPDATWTDASNVVPGDIHYYQNAGVNSGTAVALTVESVDYGTATVTYTGNVGFVFPVLGTTITRDKPGGGNGWTPF